MNETEEYLFEQKKDKLTFISEEQSDHIDHTNHNNTFHLTNNNNNNNNNQKILNNYKNKYNKNILKNNIDVSHDYPNDNVKKNINQNNINNESLFHNENSIHHMIDNNSITKTEQSQIEYNKDNQNQYYIDDEDNYNNIDDINQDDQDEREEQIGADDGAENRRQYFEFAHHQIKALDDDNDSIPWDSEFPTNNTPNLIQPFNQSNNNNKNNNNNVNTINNNNIKNINTININNGLNNNNINNNNSQLQQQTIEIQMNSLNLDSKLLLQQNKDNMDMSCSINKDNFQFNQTLDHIEFISNNHNNNNNTKQNNTNTNNKNNNTITKNINTINNINNINDQNGCIDLTKQNQDEQQQNEQEQQQKKENSHGLTGVWKHSSLLIITLVKKFENMLMSHNNQNKFRALDNRHFQVIGDISVHAQYYQKYSQQQDKIYYRKIKTQNDKILQNSNTINNNNKTKKKKSKQNQLYNNPNRFYQRQISQQTQQYYQQQEQQQTLFCFYYFMIFLLKNVKVIQPNSQFKIAWNIIVFIMTFINFFLIPLKYTFHSFIHDTWLLNAISYFSGLIFIIDALINFNSAYFSKGLIITERPKIIKNYMKKNFIIDLFTLLSFAFSLFSYKQIEAGILIKILKLSPLMENFEEILNLRQRGQAMLSLAKLIFFVLMVTHILGCTFFLFARFEEIYFPEKQNWIEAQMSWNKEWYDQYIISLYWSVVTMITVGYGDITPVNTLERLFCIIIMMISCGVFAYSINQIGRILEELSKKDAIFRDNISLITSYLKQRGISYDLQLRIRKYFQYLHKENLEDNEKSEGLMDLLPSSLKNQLGREMYTKIINEQKVFRLNFSQKFILDLSLKMKEKRLGPEEVIFQERDYLDRLYFLIKGQVELFVNVRDSNNNKSTQVNIINKGRLLGQNAFFTQLPCSTGARCINVTSLIYITRDDFLDTIKRYHKDYEKFCMFRDNLQINHISRGLGTKCHLCGSFNHSFQTCHLVRYTPMKEKIILRYNKMEQGRNPQFVRNDRRCPTSSARIAHDYLRETTINYLLDYNPADTDEESVIQTVERLRRHYAKVEEDFKKQVDQLYKENRIEEEEHYDEDENIDFIPSSQRNINMTYVNNHHKNNQNGLNSSPTHNYNNHNYAIMHEGQSGVNTDNISRQISLQYTKQESNHINGNTQPPSFVNTNNNNINPPQVSFRKKNKSLSFLQVEDCGGSETNNKQNQMNILNSPLRRKKVREKSFNSSETYNTFTLSQQQSNQQQQQQQQLFQRQQSQQQLSQQSPKNPFQQNQSSIQNTPQLLSQQNNIDSTNNNNQFSIGGFMKQRNNLMRYKTTSSRQDKQQDDSQAGNNSELLSSIRQQEGQGAGAMHNLSNMQKSMRITRRRNNILQNGLEDAELIKKNSFSDLLDLDRFMIFEFYFVDGNINKILDQYNNYFIHLKNKDEIDTLKKKRNQFQRLITKRKLTKSERSMNILKNKIIQKRSQSGKHGTMTINQGESPLTSINQTMKSGRTIQFFKNPIQESFIDSMKNNTNTNNIGNNSNKNGTITPNNNNINNLNNIDNTSNKNGNSSNKNNSNKNNSNKNASQYVSFNDCIKNSDANKKHFIYSAQNLQQSLDSSDKQSDQPQITQPLQKSILVNKKQNQNNQQQQQISSQQQSPMLQSVNQQILTKNN